jgi:hypothetical protein
MLKKLVKALLMIVCIPSLLLGAIVLAGFVVWAGILAPVIIFGGGEAIVFAMMPCVGVSLMLVGWLALKAIEKL